MNYLIKIVFFFVFVFHQSSHAAIYRYLFPVVQKIKLSQVRPSSDFLKELTKNILFNTPHEVARIAQQATDEEIKKVLPLALLFDVEKIPSLIKGRKINWEADCLRNTKYNTPLHSACSLQFHAAEESLENPEHSKIILFLLQHGAYIASLNAHHDTPLHLAIRTDNQKIVKTLLAFNPPLEIKNINGETVLHLAVKQRNVATVKILLLMGADPNTQNLLGKTPLHSIIDLAYIEQNDIDFEIVATLLNAGADPYKQQYAGLQDCFEHAKYYCPEIFYFLNAYQSERKNL